MDFLGSPVYWKDYFWFIFGLLEEVYWLMWEDWTNLSIQDRSFGPDQTEIFRIFQDLGPSMTLYPTILFSIIQWKD